MISPVAMRSAPSLLITISILGSTLLPSAAPLRSAEISGLHLVFEKPRKMRKADVTLFMPFADQARPSDTPGRAWKLSCSLVATGKKGELPVRGAVELRLLGSSRSGSARWQSDIIRSTPSDGLVDFDADEITSLVSQATAAAASVELFRVDFDGGRGKKLLKLTFDCIQTGALP
jgi:hypothetical protein